MKELRVNIPAIPVPQPRQRHAVIGGQVRNFTPTAHPVQAFKATVRLAVQQAGAQIMEGAVEVHVAFYLPRPQRLMRQRDPGHAICHTSKPDVDNLWKSLADALTGIVWRDDGQVCVTSIQKLYAEKGGQPRVELWVRERPV